MRKTEGFTRAADKVPYPNRATAQRGEQFMVAYYKDESAVDAALKAATTPEEVHKIAQDLEQRMAPSHWIQKALHVYWAML